MKNKHRLVERLRPRVFWRPTHRIMLFAVIGLLTVSCSLELFDTGVVELQFVQRINALTMLPNVSMTVESYEVSGTGPTGSTFADSTPQSSITVASLREGSWTITVDAKNAAGTVIGTGSTTTTVLAGGSTPVSVAVRPIRGAGQFELSVTWPAGVLLNPSVAGQLVPRNVSPTIDLVFDTPADGSASSSVASISSGYYTLLVQLLDGAEVVAGAVEVVRIAANKITSGGIYFSDPRETTGSATIIIDSDMEDPLTVLISGDSDAIEEGNSMTVDATTSEPISDLAYAWYLDGIPAGTGDTYTTPSNLLIGEHRIDVTAFSPSTQRSGSSAHSFSVTDIVEAIVVSATEFTLLWDAPVDGNPPVEYHIYYRTYGNVTGAWAALATVAVPTTSYTATTVDLMYGIYDFGVTSTDADGNESQVHSSLDLIAEPVGGWYIDWRAP